MHKLKYKIITIGPTPPPYHGCSVMNELLIKSDLIQEFNIKYFDISDRRGTSNIGSFEAKNIVLAVIHGIKFIYLLLRYNPEVVYISISQVYWGYLRDLLFLLPARIMNKKLLIHLHGGAFNVFINSQMWLLRWITKYIFSGKVWGIVLGDNLKACFSELLESERIWIVPNGIKQISSDEQFEKKADSKLTVLYLANLMKSKGYLDLLAIVPEVIEKHPDIKFVFAGDKAYSSEIKQAEQFINNKHLQDIVEMPGVVKGVQKMNLLASADIFVFPPNKQEGQPLVILEAMSAGLPVIATNMGAIQNTVIDECTGFVIPPENHKALLEKLFILIENERLRNTMGVKARQRFLEFYNEKRWIDEMKIVFSTVLNF